MSQILVYTHALVGLMFAQDRDSGTDVLNPETNYMYFLLVEVIAAFLPV